MTEQEILKDMITIAQRDFALPPISQGSILYSIFATQARHLADLTTKVDELYTIGRIEGNSGDALTQAADQLFNLQRIGPQQTIGTVTLRALETGNFEIKLSSTASSITFTGPTRSVVAGDTLTETIIADQPGSEGNVSSDTLFGTEFEIEGQTQGLLAWITTPGTDGESDSELAGRCTALARATQDRGQLLLSELQAAGFGVNRAMWSYDAGLEVVALATRFGAFFNPNALSLASDLVPSFAVNVKSATNKSLTLTGKMKVTSLVGSQNIIQNLQLALETIPIGHSWTSGELSRLLISCDTSNVLVSFDEVFVNTLEFFDMGVLVADADEVWVLDASGLVWEVV